jgi:hypothetical protein
MQFRDRSASRIKQHRGSTRTESFVSVNESLASSSPAYQVSMVELGQAIGGAETKVQ